MILNELPFQLYQGQPIPTPGPSKPVLTILCNTE